VEEILSLGKLVEDSRGNRLFCSICQQLKFSVSELEAGDESFSISELSLKLQTSVTL
jgi:hypothetical protein